MKRNEKKIIVKKWPFVRSSVLPPVSDVEVDVDTVTADIRFQVRPFVRSSARPFIRSSVRPFVRSTNRPFVRSYGFKIPFFKDSLRFYFFVKILRFYFFLRF